MGSKLSGFVYTTMMNSQDHRICHVTVTVMYDPGIRQNMRVSHVTGHTFSPPDYR